jgi:3-dehydroquinate dehydratase / shikimate dehydrogenase
MKICLSIAPATMSEALTELKSAHRHVDLVEIRIDGINDLGLELLLRKPRPKVIITNRRYDEGGKFHGRENEQVAILSRAIDYGADYVDIEMSWGKKIIRTLFSHSRKTKVIVSYHNSKETPNNVHTIYSSIQSIGPDIIKIATTANDIADNKIIFNLLERARRNKQPLIAHCMGERGQISRILSGKFGGYLSYTSSRSSKSTASGQINLEDFEKIYRTSAVNKATKIFGLVGKPVAQSKGKYFHNYIFKRQGLNAVYLDFLVDNLDNFIHSYRAMLSGLSVTTPFKQEIVPFLDSLEDCTSALNVVNTVIIRKKKMIGYNTDLSALLSILKNISSLQNKEVVVLGTGAMARTISFALTRYNANITIIGRSCTKAKKLSSEFNCDCAAFTELPKIKADILMNATSVGMNGNIVNQIVPNNFLKKEMIVFDAVYSNGLTPLLLKAQKIGCRIISGDFFFKRQAHLQSKLFLNNFL